MIKLFISPNYFGVPPNADNGGIRRVVEAENEHLAKFGVESVAHVSQADVIQNHGGMQTWQKGIPTIATSHGLMWSRQDWGAGMMEVNKTLVENMCMANAITAPSEWVARSIRRGGYFYPEVVYHGINADDFGVGDHPSNYVLYNKARNDLVSDSGYMNRVAQFLPDVQFFSTIGQPTGNVKIIGTMPYEEMKKIVANAGIYLSTTRETFGIGTLEAMACGVPVAGFAWGGNSEIVMQGETGYLAPPGNFKELAEAIQRCIDERPRLSRNCLEDIRTRWGWEPRIQQYANIVKSLYAESHAKRPKVTVIITAYNLDRYLPQCIGSVRSQTMTDFECLVIDDAQSETTKKLVEDYEAIDPRIKYVATPENLGLPGARNFGFSKAKGRYIRHLDADDWLGETALALEAEALDSDPHIHIAYGHLSMAHADGTTDMVQGSPKRADWPPKEFHWLEQMAHLNQIPSCVMMRREVLDRSAGYRVRNKRQEDAEFWCRVTSLGFRAKKVTEAITYFHRQRDDSKGQAEWDTQGPEPDWTAWFPWSLGAKDYRKGVDLLKKYQGKHPDPKIVPFGAQGQCPDAPFWPVHDYAYPTVSIIVTVGPGHKEWLIDALDSIQAQTFPDWECIVVNDTGEKWKKYIPGAPWAKVVNMVGNQGTAAARNEGFKYAHGICVVWMDADDYWLPWYLERMVAYAEKNDGIIYSDLIVEKMNESPDGKLIPEKRIYKYDDVKFEEVPFHMSYPGSSILVPMRIAEAIFNSQGGFDKDIPGMEDWDFQIAVHDKGYCAHHVPEALFVYRMWTSTKREKDYARIEEIRNYLDVKWKTYRKEGKKLMCGCNQTRRMSTKPGSTYASSGVFTQIGSVPEGEDPMSMVIVEYMGPIAETFSIRSGIDRSVQYRYGNNPGHKEHTVFLGDAYRLVGMIDANEKPLYRIKGSASTPQRNPSDIVGAIVG